VCVCVCVCELWARPFTLTNDEIATADIQETSVGLFRGSDTGQPDRNCCYQRADGCSATRLVVQRATRPRRKVLREQRRFGRIWSGFQNEKGQDFRWAE
jgi:hypothetical protein